MQRRIEKAFGAKQAAYLMERITRSLQSGHLTLSEKADYKACHNRSK